MKTKNLTDEQIYNLLLSQKLPFQKLEHFERFLKAEPEESVFNYIYNFGYYVDMQQLVTFVKSASIEMLRRYAKSDKVCGAGKHEIAMAIVDRGDHQAIMDLIHNKGSNLTVGTILAIIKRNNCEEVSKVLLRCCLSDEAKIAILEYDRLNGTHEIGRFYDYFGRLPEKVEIALVADGSFNQIKHYFATKFYYNRYQGKFISIDSAKVLETLLKREDMFIKLLKYEPKIEITCLDCLFEKATHEQLMLWLESSTADLNRENFSLLLKRKNVDELLLLQKSLCRLRIKDSDVSVILSLGNKTLVRQLLKNTNPCFKKEHVCQILENNWHDLFRELIGEVQAGIIGYRQILAAIVTSGNDEDMKYFLEYCIEEHHPHYLSILISSGNQEWIEMYCQKFRIVL